MFGGIGSVIFGWILWRATGNIVLAAIIAFVTWPLFSLLLKLPFILLRSVLSAFEPDVPLTIIKKSEEADGKGLRIILTPQGKYQFFSDREDKERYEKALSSALKELCEKDVVFRFKYAYYLNNKSPLRIYASGHKRVLDKVFSKFRNQLKAEGFVIGDDGQDVFTYEYKPPRGGENKAEQAINMAFVFDQTFPVQESSAAADIKSGSETSPAGRPEKPEGQLTYKILFEEYSS